MSAKSPWSVKGISPRDREAAKVAARKAGVPLGIWLSEQIRRASEDEPPAREQARQETSRPVERPIASERDRMAERRDAPAEDAPRRPRAGQADPRFAFGPGQWSVAEEAIEAGLIGNASVCYPWHFRGGSVVAARPAVPLQSVPPPMPAPRPPVPAPMPHPAQQVQAHAAAMPADTATRTDLDLQIDRVRRLEARFEELVRRIDTVEDRALARLEPILAKVEALSEEVERLASQRRSAGDGDGGFSTAPIERAVMRLSERLGRIEQAVLPRQKGSKGGFFGLFRRK